MLAESLELLVKLCDALLVGLGRRLGCLLQELDGQTTSQYYRRGQGDRKVRTLFLWTSSNRLSASVLPELGPTEGGGGGLSPAALSFPPSPPEPSAVSWRALREADDFDFFFFLFLRAEEKERELGRRTSRESGFDVRWASRPSLEFERTAEFLVFRHSAAEAVPVREQQQALAPPARPSVRRFSHIREIFVKGRRAGKSPKPDFCS